MYFHRFIVWRTSNEKNYGFGLYKVDIKRHPTYMSGFSTSDGILLQNVSFFEWEGLVKERAFQV